jgi:hypothetical protein
MNIRDADVLAGREIDHRFVEAYASYLIDKLTDCAKQEGASMEAVLLAFICAAVGVSQWDLGRRPAIPAKSNEPPVACPAGFRSA